MNKKYNLIILAGAEKGPLSDLSEFSSKAMISIHGKPMIDLVIEAYQSTFYFENIVVVGPDELDNSSTMKTIRKRVKSSGSLITNLMKGVEYVKSKIQKYSKEHNGYVISFCDAAFLTPEIINETMKNIDTSNADIVLHYVEKSSFVSAGLNAKRTFIPIDGKEYTGSVIYYVKKFSPVIKQYKRLEKLRRARKDAGKYLQIIGAENESLTGIEEAISRFVNSTVKIFVSPHPGLAMDVDTPDDLDLVTQVYNKFI